MMALILLSVFRLRPTLQRRKVLFSMEAVFPTLSCTLLFAVMGCGAYGVAGYGYGGAPQGYYDRDWRDYSPGYAPQGHYQGERYSRGWQNQGTQQPRPVPGQSSVTPLPPSAVQNKKALGDLGFRPNP